MSKQKSRSNQIITIPPKIKLDKLLDPAFAPELSEAINELIFRTRNALISHYNSELHMRKEIEENRKTIDELEAMIKVLHKQQRQDKTKKTVLKINDKKKLR
jgi:hypothetical protein